MSKAVCMFAILALAACATPPPSVTVVHTVPPALNIIPAKSVAVIGSADQTNPNDDEDDFLDLVIAKARRRGLYEIKDEREVPRAINPAHGLFEAVDYQRFLNETEGDVVAKVYAPTVSCWLSAKVVEYGEDEGEITAWIADCSASAHLFKPRTGESIGWIEVKGHGYDKDQWTSWNDGMNEAADQIVNGFEPSQVTEQIELDHEAPLAAEGIARINLGDLAGARTIWEKGQTTFPSSAPLLYNLGAICESLRDWMAAYVNYTNASLIAPQVPRYQQAIAKLNARRADAAEAAADPANVDAEKTVAANARAALNARTAYNVSGISYLPIPSGTFTMGCTKGDQDCDDNEKPAHAVTISKPFYMAFTPTTNFQYQRCVDAGACSGKSDPAKRLNPVVNVSWNDAKDFCKWAGGRLPTEAEWEYAARSGTEGWRFPWGNDAKKGSANFADNASINVEALGIEVTNARVTYPFSGTSPVGTFAPNGFGLDDMTGNASEWTSDWMGAYAGGAVTDPTGPAIGENRVIRGGSWANTGDGGRISVRYSTRADYSVETVGFRCVIDRPLTTP